uniref:Transcriptional regulator n=1 Tax=Heterorhabditis bacteriophora TaxID=37862 RepID=A0A1I7XKP0_HETBA
MMIPELKIQGNPDVCIISWTSDVIDIKRLYDMIIKRGWHLTNLQHPSGMHIMVTINHTGNGIAESLIKDIKESVQEITADAKALLYSITQIPDRSIVQNLAFSYLDACYASAPPL